MKKKLLGAAAIALLSACDDSHEAEPIDLGTPRQLVYVTDDTSQAKHGGGGQDGLVHVFEADTYARVAQFDGGGGVGELHATPDGSIVWIVATSEGTVSLFDTTTYELTELDVGVRPVHTFLSSARDEIWVGNDGSADVSVISIPNRAVTRTILTGAGHHKMAVVPAADGTLDSVYVSNITDGTITPVGADHVARTNVPGVGPVPHGMDYSFATKRVYNCSGDAAHDVEVIATTDEAGTPGNDRDTIVAWVPLPSRCSYLHVSDDGLFAFASLPGTNQLARIRLSDHDVQVFATGSAPDKFEIVGHFAYVANVISPDVSVIDLEGVLPTVTITVGAAVAPSETEGHRSLRYYDGRLFVPNAYAGTVSVIDTATNAVVATLTDMHAPVNVAVAGPVSGTTYPR